MTFTPHASVDGVVDSEQPATEKAYLAVVDAIASRATPPGELLSEGQVAEALGMSRTPVREAFLRLSQEGLLVLYPKRGAVVTGHDDVETRELLETRAMFETAAVEWMTRNGVPVGLGEELERYIARQRSTDAPLEFAKLDRALHQAIVAAAGNSIATGLFELMGPRLLRYWHRVAVKPSQRAEIVEEHEQVVTAVVDNDVETFRERLAFHLDWGATWP